MRWGFAFVLVAVCCAFAAGELADMCTAIVVGRKASVDGSVLNTHTNDCIHCDFRLARVPGRTHKPGSIRPVYPASFSYPRFVGYERGPAFHPERLEKGIWDWPESKPIGFIPQVERTYTYLEGGYGIMNEKQLAIGESTVGARLVAKPVHAGGKALFDISDLTRLAMERCATARCAIRLIGDMAVKHGIYPAEWEGTFEQLQGMSGEALTITDKEEAWVFHVTPDDTGASAVWAAQRVPDDHIAVLANGFIIRQIDLSNAEYFMASDNIFEVAIRAGLWNPETDGPFDFQRVYGKPVPLHMETYISRRWWRVLDYAAPSLKLRGNMTTTELPFSVKPDRLLTVHDLMALNRDHFEGTPYDMTKGLQAGPWGNPNRYDPYSEEIPQEIVKQGHFERPISLFRTSYSFVTQARAHLPDMIGGLVWFGPHAPHSTAYAPFYAAASEVPEAYSRGSLYRFDKQSAWWIFAALGNYAERCWKYIIADVAAEYTRIERQEVQETGELEGRALEALSLPDGEARAAALLSEYTTANANKLVAFWWDLFFNMIAKYRDGYQLREIRTPQVQLHKLFWPLWWLEAIDYWAQPEGDLAASLPKPPIIRPAAEALEAAIGHPIFPRAPQQHHAQSKEQAPAIDSERGRVLSADAVSSVVAREVQMAPAPSPSSRLSTFLMIVGATALFVGGLFAGRAWGRKESVGYSPIEGIE